MTRGRGNVANKDGKDEAAIAVVNEHPNMSNRKVSELLAGRGIKRSLSWVQTRSHKLGLSIDLQPTETRKDKMLLRIRVVDVPTTATGEEAEALLNGIEGDKYYLDKLVLTGLPDGVGSRGLFKVRTTPLATDFA